MKATNLAIAVSALALGTTLGVVGLNSISAQESGGSPSLIENLAKKFNSSTDEVKSIFDQTRQERQAERQQQVKDALDQAVKDGKITDTQQQTIQDKMAAIEKEMEEVKAAKEGLRDWAADNDIELKELLPGKGFHGPGPRGPGM